MRYRHFYLPLNALILGVLLLVPRVLATGVPIGGFLPMVGIGLTDEFDTNFNFFPNPSTSPGGIMLGAGGTAHYDVALLDTGAAVSLITDQATTDFNMYGPYPGEADGFRGTETLLVGGATGFLEAEIFDPVGLYATGLQNRIGSGSLTLDNGALLGQTNTSIIGIPAESELPNVLGLPFASQYATSIRSDQPQIFTLDGKTVRTPQIDFLPLGSGGHGIARRAPFSLNPGASFAQPPAYLLNINNLDLDHPNENPSTPTIIQGGLFLSINAENEGGQLNDYDFFFDTGADVTVVSELNASRLGFDVILDEPDFTVAVVGSGGENSEVPGFYVEEFTIQAIGGNVTAYNVPIIVLNVPNPADPGNVVDGIVGTNLLAGRNVVIDPEPALGGGTSGPHLYISDPVTSEFNWASAAPSGPWASGGNWNTAAVPDTLGIANVRHVAGGDQTATLASSTTVWELNVSGTASQTMTVQVDSGQTLTTFGGINIEEGGVIRLSTGILDAQNVEILDGMLIGEGLIKTGSGPIPGQVENRNGIVSPGNGVGSLGIEGRYSSADGGTLAIEIGGLGAGTMFDQLNVDGPVGLGGTLDATLVDLGGGVFDPMVGDIFEILVASGEVAGTFDTLLLPAGYEWFVSYNTNSVDLRVTIPGDFDGDFDADGDDLAIWEAGFGGEGEYSAADFLTWQTQFNGVAPSTVSPSTVPEPSSIALWLVGLAIGACRWRT